MTTMFVCASEELDREDIESIVEWVSEKYERYIKDREEMYEALIDEIRYDANAAVNAEPPVEGHELYDTLVEILQQIRHAGL